MKKIFSISLIASFLILLGSVEASAQRRKTTTTEPKEEPTEEPAEKKPTTTRSTSKKSKTTDEYFNESGGFKHRLWYGGNFILNYSGSNGQSAFTIGATPMVGYKIIGGLSAGPRLGIVYTSIKGYDTRNQISTVGLTDYTIGAFARYKFLKNFFVHGEHQYVSAQFYGEDSFGRIILDANNKPFKDRQGRQSSNVGVGYNSGGLIGYEVALLYNLNPPANTIQQPFDIRIGFTYNF